MWTASLDVCRYILGRCTLKSDCFHCKISPKLLIYSAKNRIPLLIRTDHSWLIEILFLSAASCVLWITSCSLLTVLWAFIIGLLGEFCTLRYKSCHLFYIFNCFLFFLNINLSSLTILTCFCNHFIFPATILHASFRTPNLKARLNTFREEFRAVWRNYSEL